MDKNIAREEGKNIERKTQREKKRKLSPLAKSAVLSRAKSSRVCYHSASKQHENVNIALPPPCLSHRSTCTTLLYSLLRSLLTYFLSFVCVDTLNPPPPQLFFVSVTFLHIPPFCLPFFMHCRNTFQGLRYVAQLQLFLVLNRIWV